ncbi:hypothetical protein LNP74_05195 [Klebsiella pneumoniae subsp. pneumoniae]|nr:hypothetical protein [Klebsiella pneumoniae subsp. pneumoniae]
MIPDVCPRALAWLRKNIRELCRKYSSVVWAGNAARERGRHPRHGDQRSPSGVGTALA